MDNFRPVCFEEREKIYSFLSGIQRIDNGFWNEFAEMNKEEFLTKGIQLILDWNNGKNLYENFVPVTFYFLYNNENNIVGVFKLRHYLNDFYRNGPGHIAYAIKKECRNKGYAKLGLHLSIQVLDKILPEEEKLIKVYCHRDNIGSFLTIQGNIPIKINEIEKQINGKKVEISENYIDRKNRTLVRHLKEKDMAKTDIDYIKKNSKNDKIKIIGAFLNINKLIGYLAFKKENEQYEIQNIEIIERQSNEVYGLFNYIYSVARVNKIKKILIDELNFEKLEKEFPIRDNYDLKVLENKNIQVNVKELFKEE